MKTKSIQQDQETICRLIYNESLSFHPDQEDTPVDGQGPISKKDEKEEPTNKDVKEKVDQKEEITELPVKDLKDEENKPLRESPTDNADNNKGSPGK